VDPWNGVKNPQNLPKRSVDLKSLLHYFTYMEDNYEDAFDPVNDAIADIAAGKLVIVTDDADRENEGDLVMAASKATPELVNQMILHARGLICVPMMNDQLRRLGISQMVQDNRESQQTDFSVSVDAANGITTGISAYDRAATINLLGNDLSTPDMLVQPGHIFPLRARDGGVLQRAGHTEAAVDLSSLAGLHPSGVICEILNDDGTLARLPELIAFKKKFGLKLISIASLIEYRHQRDCLVQQIAVTDLNTSSGKFKLHAFKSVLDGRQHFALVKGKITADPTLVRVHSENLFEDVFGVHSQNQSSSVQATLKRIEKEGKGVLLYIKQNNGGVEIVDENSRGPIQKMRMDFRDYGLGAQILSQLGIRKIRLLSSSKRKKVVALEGYNLEIVDQVNL
jgi:3,4-dihydroxy 2-butanone 4-phosphate synthase/GTP cyclohydrolase II